MMRCHCCGWTLVAFARLEGTSLFDMVEEEEDGYHISVISSYDVSHSHVYKAMGPKVDPFVYGDSVVPPLLKLGDLAIADGDLTSIYNVFYYLYLQ